MIMYSQYLFRMPEGTPKLTYEALTAYLAGKGERKIGTTVTITDRFRDRVPGFTFTLYDTNIAIIRPERVEFPFIQDAHQATAEWLGKIVRDNGLGSGIWRVRRRTADPLIPASRGYAGPLMIGGDRERPVNGYAYPVNQPGAEPWCNHDGPDAVPGRRCECRMYVPPESGYSRQRRAELASAARGKIS